MNDSISPPLPQCGEDSGEHFNLDMAGPSYEPAKFSTYPWQRRDRKATIVFLGNLDIAPMEAIARNLTAITFGEKYQLPKPAIAQLLETEMMFVKNENGQVTGVVLRLGSCQDWKAKKIE